MTWTQFHDMHSGGGQKEPHSHIYIEASEAEARVIFYNRFGHSPDRVTCTCCGEDYSLTEAPTFTQASGYERGCRSLETPRGPDGRYEHPDDAWFNAHYYLEPDEHEEAERRGWTIGKSWGYHPDGYQTPEEYAAREDVLVIPATEIKGEERVGEVPEEGYVWAGG